MLVSLYYCEQIAWAIEEKHNGSCPVGKRYMQRGDSTEGWDDVCDLLVTRG